MATKRPQVDPGNVYAIPLFVSDESPLTRFTKKDFSGADREFCFMRVIANEQGAGLVIEIFNRTGNLSTPVVEIVASPRLFRPIAISGLSIAKKRWPLVGHQHGYDPAKDSDFKNVSLVLNPHDQPRLWQGGREHPISVEQAQEFEPWTLWNACQVEKRIIAALNNDGHL